MGYAELGEHIAYVVGIVVGVYHYGSSLTGMAADKLCRMACHILVLSLDSSTSYYAQVSYCCFSHV